MGALLCVAALLGLLPEDAQVAGLIGGAVGIALGAGYNLSPTWRLEVITDDEGIEVRRGQVRRFRLDWHDIEMVIASPATNTCFVNGGSPECSLLVPGFGAPASYDLSDKATLFRTIVAAVPSDRITEVESLDSFES